MNNNEENKQKGKCKYLGGDSGDCWRVNGNVFQKCISKNKEKCILLKNDQLKLKIDTQQQQLAQAREENEKIRNILRQDYCLEYQPYFDDVTLQSTFKQVFKFKGQTFEYWDSLTSRIGELEAELEEIANYQQNTCNCNFQSTNCPDYSLCVVMNKAKQALGVAMNRTNRTL